MIWGIELRANSDNRNAGVAAASYKNLHRVGIFRRVSPIKAPNRRRSSVVERILGKAEVVGSIPPGGTISDLSAR